MKIYAKLHEAKKEIGVVKKTKTSENALINTYEEEENTFEKQENTEEQENTFEKQENTEEQENTSIDPEIKQDP